MDNDSKLLSEAYSQMHYKNVRLSDSQIAVLIECVEDARQNGEIGPGYARDLIQTLEEA